MAIERTAKGTWHGDLKSGNGLIDSTSDALQSVPFTYATRFENAPGTNPEELIAAAHAACYSMAFSNYLSQQGHVPDKMVTEATTTLDGGRIVKIHLETRGQVKGLNSEQFKKHAEEAEKKCPVSNSFRGCIEITVNAELAG